MMKLKPAAVAREIVDGAQNTISDFGAETILSMEVTDVASS